MAEKIVAVRNLGRMSYGQASKIMADIAKQKLLGFKGKSCNKLQDTLLIVEHNPVFTVGTRSNVYLGHSRDKNDQIDKRLKELGAEFCVTNRGGLITYHGPGQLVCYPVLNLRHFKPSVRWYINSLEQVIIETCKEFNINVGRTKDIGVWIEDRKIAAIGKDIFMLLPTNSNY